MGFLLRVHSVTLYDIVHSCEIHRALIVEPLLLEIKRSQLHWFGHVSRMPTKRLARQVLLTKPTGKQPSGHPRTRWVTTSPTLLGPALVWSQHNYLKLLLTMRYFESSQGCCPCVVIFRRHYFFSVLIISYIKIFLTSSTCAKIGYRIQSQIKTGTLL